MLQILRSNNLRTPQSHMAFAIARTLKRRVLARPNGRACCWNGGEQKPKTENTIRSVGIPKTLAAFLNTFAGDRTSRFLFQTDSGRGLPLFPSIPQVPTSQESGALGLGKFWIGHASKDITDKHAEQLKEDVDYRREWADRVGLIQFPGSSGSLAVATIPKAEG